MRGEKAAALAAALLVLLSGCGRAALPYAREMGDMALLRTMGVDAGASAALSVTVSTGRRTAGLQGEPQSPLVLTAERDSLSAACLAMQGLSDSYVFYGYVDQLLLGEGMALRGVWPVLEFFARDTQLGLGTQVWLVRGDTAQSAIQSGGQAGVDSRLTTLRTDGEMGAAGAARTVGELFSGLLEGGSAYLPALRAMAQDQEGETALLEAGYGVLKDGALVGYLEGESARGLELLAGRAATDILEIPLGAGQGAARITGASLICAPVFQGEELTELQLTCRVTAEVAELPSGQRELSPRDLEALRDALERREGARLRRTLDQLRSWRADCVGLGAQVARAAPHRWADLEDRWPQLFASIKIKSQVQVTVSRA